MDTRFERVERVLRMDGNGLGGKDGTVIHTLIRDEVDHDTGMIDLSMLVGFESTLDCMGAGERSRQGRVQVDDPVRKTGQEIGRENTHPAGQDDVVGSSRGYIVG